MMHCLHRWDVVTSYIHKLKSRTISRECFFTENFQSNFSVMQGHKNLITCILIFICTGFIFMKKIVVLIIVSYDLYSVVINPYLSLNHLNGQLRDLSSV